MSEKTCPICHASIPAGAPGGFCPACLLREAGEPLPGRDAPSIEAIAAAFPQLEILSLIGHGGMGFVYKARQPHLERTVALKILSPELQRDPACEERFAREARVLGKLQHPNIVTLYEHGESSGFFYLLMEYVEGVNLRQAMAAGRFTPEQALAIVPAICDALQSAHSQGVWHRDIKPENILLDRDGRVKIADFGIARLAGDPARNFTLTRTHGLLGSAAYMAPEQHEKPHDVDHRADIYSLGVVIYEMLTGELPLGRFPLPSQRAAVNERIDEIVLRTLEKERELRQQTAGEVKTEVEGLQTYPSSAAESTVRIPAKLIFGSLMLLIAASLIALLALKIQPRNSPGAAMQELIQAAAERNIGVLRSRLSEPFNEGMSNAGLDSIDELSYFARFHWICDQNVTADRAEVVVEDNSRGMHKRYTFEMAKEHGLWRLDKLGTTPKERKPAANPTSQSGNLVQPASGEEERELRRLGQLVRSSPDLLRQKQLLIDTIEKGWAKPVSFLLEQANSPEFDRIALMTAAKKGHLEIVKAALARGIDPKGESGADALHSAAESDYLAIAKTLLDAGASPDGKQDGELPKWITPLLAATRHGHTQMARLLIERGADVNLMPRECPPDFGPNPLGYMGAPLHEAVRVNARDVFDLLLEKGADANLASPQSKITPLWLACWLATGDSAMVKRMLDAGADPDAESASDPIPQPAGWNRYPGKSTPTDRAVIAGSAEKLKQLLEAKKKRQTPIQRNILRTVFYFNLPNPEKSLEITRLLLDAGADPNPPDGMYEMLLEKWCDGFAITKPEEKSILQQISKENSNTAPNRIWPIIELLIERGSKIDPQWQGQGFAGAHEEIRARLQKQFPLPTQNQTR